MVQNVTAGLDVEENTEAFYVAFLSFIDGNNF